MRNRQYNEFQQEARERVEQVKAMYRQELGGYHTTIAAAMAELDRRRRQAPECTETVAQIERPQIATMAKETIDRSHAHGKKASERSDKHRSLKSSTIGADAISDAV